MNISLNEILYIAKGIGLNLQYTLIALTIGTIIALVLAYFRYESGTITKIIINTYISVLRGTPIMVQLMLAYFALPALLKIDISGYMAGLLAFSLNSSAYMAEIIRAGMQSIPKGQYEAGKVLGIPKYLMMKDIIIPQAIKNSFPAFVNEATSLLKETAIISVIGQADIMRRAHIISVEHYSYLAPLIIAAITYYVLVVLISTIGGKLERKLSYA